MEVIRRLHASDIRVGHRFDIRERIDFYEKLCRSHGGVLFEDYDQVRGWMDELMDALDRMGLPECLCHIDANVDNFLFLPDGTVKLLDWEYAGMCNPIMDISMCAIYSYYDRRGWRSFLPCIWAVSPRRRSGLSSMHVQRWAAFCGVSGRCTKKLWGGVRRVYPHYVPICKNLLQKMQLF